jgi:predicted HTH transcriptional regulator
MEFSAKVLEFIKENGPSTATAIEGAITGKSEDIRKAIVGLRDSGGLIVSGRKGRGELLTIGTDWDVIDQNAPVESDLSDA